MSSSDMLSVALRSSATAGRCLAAVRGQQLMSLLLVSIPLAERMLLYHMAMTAWTMLPARDRFGKSSLPD